MAAPSSKPSSSPTSSRTNPVSRNSELNNPMRRSFSANPFAKPSVISNPRALNAPNTPFNSPSDLRRRQSTDRETAASMRDFEDKENGKDPNPKPARARSPAPSKITKNFMSPTISAASKINPSPRKKILVERKCLVTEENELKEEIGLHHQKKNEALESDSSLLAVSTTSEEKDLVNLEPTFNKSPRVCSSPMPLAPLDADLSIPPYDPKTNYLSPRPQFLHYKPNPRIELYGGRESKQLEASISDTDVTTEETWSDDSQRESEELSSSEMEKEENEGEEENELLLSVPASTVTDSAVESVEAQKKSKAKFFSGSKLVALLLVLALALHFISGNDLSAYHQALEGFGSEGFQVSAEVAQLAKARFFMGTLSYISQNIRVREMHDPFSLHYANLSGLFDDNLVAGHLKFEQRVVEPPIIGIVQTEVKPADGDGDQWETTETGEEAEQLHDGVQAHVVEADQAENFEVVLEDHVAASEQLDEQIETEIVEVQQAEDSEAVFEDHVTASEQLDEQIETEIVEVQQAENSEAVFEDHVTASVQLDKQIETEIVEVQQAENSESVFEDHVTASELLDQQIETEIVEVQQAENSESVFEYHFTASELLDQQIETEIVEVSHVGMEQVKETAEIFASQAAIQLPDFNQEEPSEANTNDDVQTEFKEADERPERSQLEASSIDNAQGPRAAEGKFSVENVSVASLALLCLCAAAAAILLAKRKNNSASNGSAPEQVPAKKSEDTSPISVAVKRRASQERSCSRNWQTDDLVDLVSQSGPSQMSSIQKSSKELEGCGEAQSRERRPRSNYKRESLASSDYSMGGSPSYSYGSFTTHEKIPSKHGGEEEIVTPVRRSSRIRKQVTPSAS